MTTPRGSITIGNPLLACLGAHHLFSSFDAAGLERLAQSSRLVALENEESLFHQGSEAHSFYLVKSGSIKLFRVSPDGLAKVIEVVRQGDAFAEALMFLEQKVYPLNAEAMGQAEVIVIPSQIYKELLLSSPESALGVMGNMAMKLHRRINEIETLTLQNTRHRLSNYLFGLLPDPAAEFADIVLPMAKQLIASQLAMQPETLSRLIKEMKIEGIISVKGSRIQVHDVTLLRTFGH
ncbi:Crp/Fnr family transcriptional regulator [uncultured Neptuniibacter sp.]|uniref:Crp/Fnr family transcriptional regulator n=1 Tax=uncultured Neptuniibacter sp. TaxID=502143 RepID=UPI00261FAACC|nr:Crp/Fnr family transcriptional regulator [uncultured Neptuniibacter sp.]